MSAARPDMLLGAGWAVWALHRVRRQLRWRRIEEVAVPAPWSAARGARRGVQAVLRRVDPSCLERALVLQRWLAAAGDPRAIAIGVTAPSDFRAHAWLEGESGSGFVEIARMPPCAG